MTFSHLNSNAEVCSTTRLKYGYQSDGDACGCTQENTFTQALFVIRSILSYLKCTLDALLCTAVSIIAKSKESSSF